MSAIKTIYIIGVRCLVCCLVLLCFFSCNNVERLEKRGDKYFALGEYYEAGEQYKKAYSALPPKERLRRGKVAVKMADCYRRINVSGKAVGALNNALRYKAADSLSLFYLAEMQRREGNYKQAMASYEAFLDSNPGHRLAVLGRESCEEAPLWRANPNSYTVKKMDVFNSRRADFAPALWGDGDEYTSLYITSSRPQARGDELSGITGTKYTDIFVAKRDDKGVWKAPEEIESDINSDYDDGACSFSPDMKTMYFTRCEMDASYPRYAQIYISTRSDASWSAPKLMEITKDTLSSFAHPAVSPDGKWLYFVSDMPGGYGGLDIWRTMLTGNGTAGVENLGPDINTEGNEMFPSFRGNGEFYFSSDGHGGMGGLDIFRATEDSTVSLRWEIENLRYPMNSSGDDFGMTFEGVHNRGFFASNRNDGKGWDHIYSFYCPEIIQTVKGWVYEKDGYELPDAQVYMVGNDGTNEKLSVRTDGSFTKVIKPGVSYVFLGTCNGYLNQKQELQVEPVTESEEYVLQFPLASITAPVLLQNVFYEFDKADLTEASTQELDGLVRLLNTNTNITIELSAHCDYRGNDAYNMALSQRRAESCVRYLRSQGIAADRLTPRGYGEQMPKVVKRKMAAEHSFLHEGDTLTEAYIRKLPEEQQEICNAYNRRTEFKVLRTTYGLFDRKKE